MAGQCNVSSKIGKFPGQKKKKLSFATLGFNDSPVNFGASSVGVARVAGGSICKAPKAMKELKSQYIAKQRSMFQHNISIIKHMCQRGMSLNMPLL